MEGVPNREGVKKVVGCGFDLMIRSEVLDMKAKFVGFGSKMRLAIT